MLGIILGSIPPCRGPFVRAVARLRGKAVTDEEDTLGVRAPRSGRSYLLGRLSRVSQPFSRRSKTSDWQSIEGDNPSKYLTHSAGSVDPVRSARRSEAKSGIMKTVEYGTERSDAADLEMAEETRGFARAGAGND